PRRNASPVAMPTLRASSGVSFDPFASPRIPSVPKYLRAMSPSAASLEASADYNKAAKSREGERAPRTDRHVAQQKDGPLARAAQETHRKERASAFRQRLQSLGAAGFP